MPQLAADGSLLEPRHLIREYVLGAGNVVEISLGADPSLIPLVPRDGETAAEYRDRLEQPVERTAAWRIALTAPVSVRLEGPELEGHREALLSYLRTLLA